jgi:F0F1-type ATP synthase membrane subunit b/b'
MAENRKSKSERAAAEAKTKLRRLLETETELEAALKETRRDAKARIESARAAAEERIRMLEAQLVSDDEQLRAEIALERDETINSIREQARADTERLDGLDASKLDELARHVVDLLIGRQGSGGRQ